MPSIVAGYVVTLLDDDQGVLYTAFLPHVCLLYLTLNQSLDMIDSQNIMASHDSWIDGLW